MKPLLVLLLIFCLLLSSCSSSQIVTTLEAVVTAAEIAIPSHRLRGESESADPKPHRDVP